MRTHALATLALTLATWTAQAAAADEATARFRLRGELKPAASSSDGRFTLQGTARVTPTQGSDEGRFVLKSTNASCNPLDFSIFADGFEGP